MNREWTEWAFQGTSIRLPITVDTRSAFYSDSSISKGDAPKDWIKHYISSLFVWDPNIQQKCITGDRCTVTFENILITVND